MMTKTGQRAKCHQCQSFTDNDLSVRVLGASDKAINALLNAERASSIIRNGGWESCFRNHLMIALEAAKNDIIGFTEGLVVGAKPQTPRIDLVVRCVHCHYPLFVVETKANLSTQNAKEIAVQLEDGWAKLNGLSVLPKPLPQFSVNVIAQVSSLDLKSQHVNAHNSAVSPEYKQIKDIDEYPSRVSVTRERQPLNDSAWYPDGRATQLPLIPTFTAPRRRASNEIDLEAKVWVSRVIRVDPPGDFALEFFAANGQIREISRALRADQLQWIRLRNNKKKKVMSICWKET